MVQEMGINDMMDDGNDEFAGEVHNRAMNETGNQMRDQRTY